LLLLQCIYTNQTHIRLYNLVRSSPSRFNNCSSSIILSLLVLFNSFASFNYKNEALSFQLTAINNQLRTSLPSNCYKISKFVTKIWCKPFTLQRQFKALIKGINTLFINLPDPKNNVSIEDKTELFCSHLELFDILLHNLWDYFHSYFHSLISFSFPNVLKQEKYYIFSNNQNQLV